MWSVELRIKKFSVFGFQPINNGIAIKNRRCREKSASPIFMAMPSFIGWNCLSVEVASGFFF